MSWRRTHDSQGAEHPNPGVHKAQTPRRKIAQISGCRTHKPRGGKTTQTPGRRTYEPRGTERTIRGLKNAQSPGCRKHKTLGRIKHKLTSGCRAYRRRAQAVVHPSQAPGLQKAFRRLKPSLDRIQRKQRHVDRRTRHSARLLNKTRGGGNGRGGGHVGRTAFRKTECCTVENGTSRCWKILGDFSGKTTPKRKRWCDTAIQPVASSLYNPKSPTKL